MRTKNFNFVWFFTTMVLIGLLFSQCGKGKKTEIPFFTYVEIPAGLNPILTHHFVIDTVRGTLVENIIEAQPANLVMTLEEGEPNFNFVENVTLDVINDSTQLEIGYHINVPMANSQNVIMLPSLGNVADFIKEDMFTVRLNLDTRASTTNLSRVRLDFTVQATLDEE